jgi:hypothetical protein
MTGKKISFYRDLKRKYPITAKPKTIATIAKSIQRSICLVDLRPSSLGPSFIANTSPRFQRHLGGGETYLPGKHHQSRRQKVSPVRLDASIFFGNQSEEFI